MSLPESIAHYKILSKLGEGGMGAVYRATDTKLNRDVAIKVLPDAFAQDTPRMQRFEREAQVLASLNHPNIAAIYGIEQGAIVMELVDGEDLKTPLPIDTAIAYARQIAVALEAAHEKGIVHRDLKPANIKVTTDGTVKLLDFGLAKASESTAPPANTLSPTLSMQMTQAGMILGTAAYMSPEQARGKAVDRRTDIWAFGVVLYEMLTGKSLFASGETVTDVIAAVVTREPDWSALPAATPPHIRKLLQRCLRKDVKTRLQAIGEARVAIDEPEKIAEPATPRKASVVPYAIAAIAIVAAALGWWQATRPSAPRPFVQMNVEMSPDLTLTPGTIGGMMAISPDGSRIAVTARGSDGTVRLYTRLLSESRLTPVTGSENGSTPFFSPDGQSIGFGADGKIKRASVHGSGATVVCDAPAPRGASWGDDGYIVFTPSAASGLLRVPATGGSPVELTKRLGSEGTHRWPHVLPGSSAVLFTADVGGSNFDNAEIASFSMKTGQRKAILRGGYSPAYVPGPGTPRLLYVSQNRMFAVPFDAEHLAAKGTPVPILDGVSNNVAGGASFSVSASGSLVYLTGTAQQGNWRLGLQAASGDIQLLHSPTSNYYTPAFSPDGRRLAFSTNGAQGIELSVKDLERNSASALTFLTGSNAHPVWMPDGKSIIFVSTNPAAPGLYWIRADGGNEPQRLNDDGLEQPYSVSHDGKYLASSNGGGTSDLWVTPIEGDSTHLKLGKRQVFLGTPAIESHPVFSPDGHWLAYDSWESNTGEVYVRPFPGPGGKWLVSQGGGTFPQWSRDGRELLYMGPGARIMAVSYTAKGDIFTLGVPRVWSPEPLMQYGNLKSWDLAPDGKHAAVLWPEKQLKPITHLTFLLNFFDDLDHRIAGR
jgi:Tol biopolymer transport system component/predicted Ser/Thr protein kinase